MRTPTSLCFPFSACILIVLAILLTYSHLFSLEDEKGITIPTLLWCGRTTPASIWCSRQHCRSLFIFQTSNVGWECTHQNCNVLATNPHASCDELFRPEPHFCIKNLTCSISMHIVICVLYWIHWDSLPSFGATVNILNFIGLINVLCFLDAGMLDILVFFATLTFMCLALINSKGMKFVL